jgi:hypothetical protein
MPAPPFCWSDQVGSVNSLGSDFGVGAGANGGIGTVGVWNYRCAAHPLHTGKFSVAINQAQIATVPLPIGASCALPASLQIFLGDKLSITNNAQVAYMFRIDNSLGNLIIQFYINIGETRVVDSALTAGLGGGQTFKYYCDAQIGTGTLNVGFSRSNAPGSTPPPTPVPPTPPPTPSPAPGAPTNAPTPSPTLPPTPSPTPVPQGGILTPPPDARRPGADAGARRWTDRAAGHVVSRVLLENVQRHQSRLVRLLDQSALGDVHARAIDQDRHSGDAETRAGSHRSGHGDCNCPVTVKRFATIRRACERRRLPRAARAPRPKRARRRATTRSTRTHATPQCWT